MKIMGIDFDVDVDWDRDGRIDTMAVFLKGSDQELSDVLSDKVLVLIENELYRTYEGPNVNDDDTRSER